MNQTDVIIVGGGLVGLATAYQLIQRFPTKRITVLEKEASVAVHQSGNNSGVLHSGIYYKPGSLKALNCRRGKVAMEAFCQQYGVDYEICGKVIVAVEESELPILQGIHQRGEKNGVRSTIIDRDRLLELEPHAAGIQAIHVPEAGICDFRAVCRKLAEILRSHGGDIVTSAPVKSIRTGNGEVVAVTGRGDFRGHYLVNCAGLHSDRVARMTGENPDSMVVPFRGEYYELKSEVRYLCRNLIYPVPDPNFPFLGVHFTRMTDGRIECGPNAVLAFAREGYRKRDINVPDLVEALTYKGFLRLASRHWRMGFGEMWRSLSKRAFVRALRRLMPGIRSNHLVTARAGVRAQAISPDGSMVDDFVLLARDRIVNVCNAPSPAATSSLNIGQAVVDKLSEQF
jgi:L-2-hydroxyglutarate oxidase